MMKPFSAAYAIMRMQLSGAPSLAETSLPLERAGGTELRAHRSVAFRAR
jgi:hypothetical protein